MRISEKSKQVIIDMEAKGYVWLSHLDVNSQMRFRNLTRAGFTNFIKLEGQGKTGLTFISPEIVEILKSGETRNGKRASAYIQLAEAKKRIAVLEKEKSDLQEKVRKLSAKHA